MKIILIGIGFIVGLSIGSASSALLGALLGALVAFALTSIADLQSQVSTLQSHVSTLQATLAAWLRDRPASDELTRAVEPPIVPSPRQDERPVEREPDEPTPAIATVAAAETPYTVKPWADTTDQPVVPDTRPVAEPRVPADTDFVTRMFTYAGKWSTTGNIPVKVGVIVSFLGVAFLLRYAIDRQLLVISIEMRFLAAALFGAALTTIGWRLRERVRTYALTLQGGGIGILYLTIFASLRLYDLIPAGFAFGLLVVLTVAAGILAVLQDARILAIFGIAGGFLAPVLTSTGAGNHVVLFSFYLLLNAGILGIAWFRAWRELNLLGFLFTFVIGGAWGVNRYQPELFATTEPFLVLYFLFYQAIAILYASRQSTDLKGIVDGTLVFGTPVIVFGMQAQLVAPYEFGLAYSALAAALAYVVTAAFLYRRQPSQFRVLVESFVALGVAFGTLAIPLALDARWTAAAWALEGAALIWIGVRQDRILAQLAGFALAVGSGFAFLWHGWQHDVGLPFLNGNFLGGALISLAALFSSRYLSYGTEEKSDLQSAASVGLFIWAFVWWFATGAVEITDRVPSRYGVTYLMLFLSGSMGVLSSIALRFDWPDARAGLIAYLPALMFLFGIIAVEADHPFENFGWISWTAAFAVQYFIMWQHRASDSERHGMLHSLALVMISATLAWELSAQVGRLQVGGIWQHAVASLVPGILLIALIRLRGGTRWPLAAYRHAYLLTGGAWLVLFQLGGLLWLNATSAGDPRPLAYIPLLNPLDVATAFAVLVAWLWLLALRDEDALPAGEYAEYIVPIIGAIAFFVSTAAVVRGIHFLGGVPLHHLFDSDLVQSALSIYWGILGFIGMLWGARHAQRRTWLAGAGLMAVVVIKLFLIDLGNSGTVERIISFIGTGGLLLVIGYFAPVPPRSAEEPDDTLSEEA